MIEQIELTPRPALSVSLAEPPALRVILTRPALLTSLQPLSRPVLLGPAVMPSLEVLQALMGPSGQVEIEAVETLPPGALAEVENVGTPQHARLIFRLPKGDLIPEIDSDPADPVIGAAWVKRNTLNPAGTLQYMAGGFPMITAEDESEFFLSYKTSREGIRRVKLA